MFMLIIMLLKMGTLSSTSWFNLIIMILELIHRFILIFIYIQLFMSINIELFSRNQSILLFCRFQIAKAPKHSNQNINQQTISGGTVCYYIRKFELGILQIQYINSNLIQQTNLFIIIDQLMLPENQQDQNMQSFDQKPIGQSQKIPDLSEYPPDFNPNQINQVSKPEPLPLQKRIHSKVWKIRKQALQQLYNQVNQNCSAYQQYLKDTVTFITDSTPVCQQKALKVLLKYLQGRGSTVDDPKPILKALIEKCLVVQKGQTCNLATQIMFWMMDNYQAILLNQVNDNIVNKNPKICASTLTFLQKLLNNYGAKKLKQFQQFGKSFTLLSNSVRPIAKQQTIGLFKQLFKWIGENSLGFNLHPEVKEQIVKFSKTYVKQPMIIKRGLNQDQKRSTKPIVQNMDDDENQQPQDVLVPYDSRWVDKVLQQTKWKQKKSILDQFIKKTKVKNIIPRETSHFITLIKRLLSDNNINLLQCGFKVVKNLCNGLKKNFTHPSKVILSLIISKLRDTKAMIVDQAQQTLLAMMSCLNIDDLLEDIKQGLKDKAPNMRFQTLKFLQKILAKRDKIMMNAFRNLTIQIIQLNQDGSSQVRDKALDVLCKLKAAYGLNFFGDRLKKIQDKKLQTIQNYIDPNESQIDEEPIQQKCNQIYSKVLQKKVPKAHSPKSQVSSCQSQSVGVGSKPVSMPEPKISTFGNQFQFQSLSQNTRIYAYQNLLQKSGQIIHQELIEGFKNKIPMYKQSNPIVLKIILSCVKKAVHNLVGVQHLQLLMHHDWKKCKSLLTQFIQSSKLNLQALEYVKNSGILPNQNQASKRNQQIQRNHQRDQNSNSITNSHAANNSSQINSSLNAQQSYPHLSNNTNALKHFYSSIHGLIPKMSNPDPIVRLQAVQTALQILKHIPIGAINESSVEPTAAVTQGISQLFNVLKFRIQDSNQEISNNYIKLITQMLTKGFLTKYRTPGRLLISMLLQRVHNPHLTNLNKFIEQMVSNHSTILWQFLPTQLSKQNLCSSILNIIKNNSQSFFKNADQKTYMLSLLNCISKDLQIQKCSQLLDQIVQINGQHCLQKIVKQNKLSGFNIQNYLKKWKIHINNHNSATGNNHGQQKLKSSTSNSPNNAIFSFGPNINTTVHHSKLQRVNSQSQNAWPLTPSPTHILRMMTQMINMGEPFQTLASPTLLTENQLSIINNLRADILQDYSDIFVKWIFWRINIQSQSKNIQTLLNLIYRVISLGFQLLQSEIITVLGALTSCFNMHKGLYLKHICKINSYLNQHPLYRQKTFRFWINSFNDPTAPVDQILSLIINSSPDMIPSEMVTLARFPCVVKNKQFNEYLKANFTQKLLIVYGFKLQDSDKTQKKQIISSNLSLQDLTQVQGRYFIELFQRSTSNELVDKIIQQTYGIPNEYIMETHLKIMHSIVVPYLNGQLSFINVYNYFKHLQKLMVPGNCAPFLLNLVKTLAYLLIDLDELKLQNYSQMVKTINKLLLILLQISDPKQILQVLFVMMKQQLKNTGNIKLTLLIPKCIGKVIKNHSFRSSYQRNAQNTQCLSLIINQFLEIVCTMEIGPQSSIMKTMKNLLNQMISIFPQSVNIFQNILKTNAQNLPQKGKVFINQLIKDKSKQNSSEIYHKNQNSYTNTQVNYSQPKDLKSAGNMIKCFKTAGTPFIGTGNQSGRKQHQKMGE